MDKEDVLNALVGGAIGAAVAGQAFHAPWWGIALGLLVGAVAFRECVLLVEANAGPPLIVVGIVGFVVGIVVAGLGFGTSARGLLLGALAGLGTALALAKLLDAYTLVLMAFLGAALGAVIGGQVLHAPWWGVVLVLLVGLIVVPTCIVHVDKWLGRLALGAPAVGAVLPLAGDRAAPLWAVALGVVGGLLFVGLLVVMEHGWSEAVTIGRGLLSRLARGARRAPADGDAFLNAIWNGDTRRVKSAVKGGADVNLVDYNTNGRPTALMLALAAGREDIARFLISNGADVNGRDANGNTGLFKLEMCKNKGAMATLLIEHGADVNLRNGFGRTALDFCTPAVATILKNAGAK